MSVTASPRRLTGVRNRFNSRCADCGEAVGPDSGFLYEKAEGRRWAVQCDGCAEGARVAEKLFRAFMQMQGVPACLLALGLTPPTDADQIKRAYRLLASRAHPDHGGTEREFIELNRHYKQALALVGCGGAPW